MAELQARKEATEQVEKEKAQGIFDRYGCDEWAGRLDLARKVATGRVVEVMQGTAKGAEVRKQAATIA